VPSEERELAVGSWQLANFGVLSGKKVLSAESVLPQMEME